MANEQNQLPLFYKSLIPLTSTEHLNFGIQTNFGQAFAHEVNAVPITVDEFAAAQRYYPIVFAPGPDGGTPLVLLGLREGENLFCDKEGKWNPATYVPAYVRRYPFLLAKLAPDAEELSLCFDDQSGVVIAGGEGKLFEGTEPSDVTKNILSFCEQFEHAVQRTRQFMQDINELDLLVDAEATINEGAQPIVFRGFHMIAEDKVQNMHGDKARKLVKSGGMGLIYAHFFSLQTMRELYAMRMAGSNSGQ